MKMRTTAFFSFTLITLSILVATVTSSEEPLLKSPVDEVDDLDEDVPRPIRATARSPQQRGRTRNNGRSRSRSRGGGGSSEATVQKRRLPAFRPTRAPLFEASPPDPYLDGEVGPHGHNGHSHGPPTPNPYYSPSKYERERKRKRTKVPTAKPHAFRNSFDLSPEIQTKDTYEQDSQASYKVPPGKNYAFAYAVGDDAEDFSHKQANDGQMTIGEYRITLPDGRTQVVRYTAGGDNGYKADVTYEKAHLKSQPLPPAGPSPNLGGYRNHPSLSAEVHKQYHQSIQPTIFSSPVSSTSPSFNSNRVFKGRPLKTTPLYNEDPEEEDEDDLRYQLHSPASTGAPPQPPRIRFKGNHPRAPTPTANHLDFSNSVSPSPTPRPNSIYDKISPYRGGGTFSSEDLAYAHEHSPRAGPKRGKFKNTQISAAHPPPPPPPPKVGTTAATYYGSPKINQPHASFKSTRVAPRNKYKDPAQYYTRQQPQANHVKEYVRPNKNFQYLQETPVGVASLGGKHLKESSHQVQVPHDHYKVAGPVRSNYVKPKKYKKKHGIHNPLGQYLLQTPLNGQTPSVSYQSTSSGGGPLLPKEPFHYYNSFHESHHHGFGQISTNSLNSNNNNYAPSPSPYPVTAYPTRPYFGEDDDHEPVTHSHNQPRIRLPNPPSTQGHVYLETPASGARPNRLGVKEALARLPNIPSPKTTVHPYEVGSADYGKSVAYGNAPQDKEAFLQKPFQFEHDNGAQHLDHTSALFGAVGGGGESYNFPNDQFNFLDGFNNYDIEQANVREIRQPRQKRRRHRRPDKRRGAPSPLSTAPASPQEVQSSPRSPPPRRHGGRSRAPPPPSRRRQPSPSPTAGGKVKRRRTRTQQPDPMMHAVESRSGRGAPGKIRARN